MHQQTRSVRRNIQFTASNRDMIYKATSAAATSAVLRQFVIAIDRLTASGVRTNGIAHQPQTKLVAFMAEGIVQEHERQNGNTPEGEQAISRSAAERADMINRNSQPAIKEND